MLLLSPILAREVCWQLQLRKFVYSLHGFSGLRQDYQQVEDEIPASCAAKGEVTTNVKDLKPGIP